MVLSVVLNRNTPTVPLAVLFQADTERPTGSRCGTSPRVTRKTLCWRRAGQPHQSSQHAQKGQDYNQSHLSSPFMKIDFMIIAPHRQQQTESKKKAVSRCPTEG